MKYRLITVCLGLLFASTVLGQIGSKGCNKLERSEDRFENTVRISTPYKLTNLFRVIKVISETDVATYLSIRTGGYTASVGEKGVILLLEDGTKLEWPNEVIDCDVNTNGPGFSYTAFIRLTDEQIDQLAASKVSGAKLHIYEAPAYKKNVAEFMQQMGCIKEMN